MKKFEAEEFAIIFTVCDKKEAISVVLFLVQGHLHQYIINVRVSCIALTPAVTQK